MTSRTHKAPGIWKSLGEVDVLRELPREELWTLSTFAREQTFQRGQLIEGLGRDEGGVFAVLHGAVRVYLAAFDGRQITLQYRYSGEAFELQAETLSGQVATLGQAMADDTTVASLPWATFLDVVMPRAAHVIDTLLQQALEEERKVVRELAFSTVKARLAHKLAALSEAESRCVVHKTREELAAMVGTRPEEVTKLLADFREEGLISYQPYDRLIAVLDQSKLAAL